MQFYTQSEREGSVGALPDGEVFYMSAEDIAEVDPLMEVFSKPGWYWWACFPGCLPDSDPVGPFESRHEAVDDARDY